MTTMLRGFGAIRSRSLRIVVDLPASSGRRTPATPTFRQVDVRCLASHLNVLPVCCDGLEIRC